MPCVNWIEVIQFASVQRVSQEIHSRIAFQKVMNAIQMFVVKTVVVVLLTIRQFVSAYRNMKEIHQLCHVNHQKMHAQYHLADQTHNVLDCQMESLSVHVYQVLSKVRIRFVVVLNRKALVNHSHVDWELLAMSRVVQIATVQKELLVIHSDNAYHQKLQKNFADQVHADQMPIVTLQIVVNSVLSRRIHR